MYAKDLHYPYSPVSEGLKRYQSQFECFLLDEGKWFRGAEMPGKNLVSILTALENSASPDEFA